jgi:hypothetical protein
LDEKAGPIGGKGIGELGATGVAAAARERFLSCDRHAHS